MRAILHKNRNRLRRSRHVRSRLRKTTTLVRLSVVRTSEHISAQLIDDAKGHTLASVTSTAKSFADQLSGKTKSEQANILGLELASRAKDAGIEKIAFDRGSSKYHGRVKAFAEGAREGGLKF
ncbi:MAG: large subunit ribosomal protein L18 [Planctomycetota bacterium]|jgi:large subunit ribosomal protein L18